VRILFVTHYFHPEVGAPQSRLLDIAMALVGRGHDVTVLTGFPNYPDGKVPARYRGRLMQTEHLEGLRIVRTAVYPAPNRGLVRRLANHCSFALSSLASSGRTGPADAVVVETPPLLTAAAGVILGRLKRSPVVLNVADLWPDAVIALGALHNRAAIAAARALERFAYHQADVIAVPTPGLQRVLLDRGQSPQRVTVVPHGVDARRFSMTAPVDPVLGRVVYCGTIGMGHATRTLISAARMLENAQRSVEFLIVGDGAERAPLEALVREWRLKSVRFTGRVPRQHLPGLLASAQVTVATQRDVPLLADALSTKVLEYMAAARPVIGAVSGWTAEVIERAGAGVVCPPEQPAALAEAIEAMTADPVGARAMGLSGRRYVERELSRDAAVERLEDALESLVGRRRGHRSRDVVLPRTCSSP
jgi:glycosyltransferase involved in cell wall biosynthesis